MHLERVVPELFVGWTSHSVCVTVCDCLTRNLFEFLMSVWFPFSTGRRRSSRTVDLQFWVGDLSRQRDGTCQECEVLGSRTRAACQAEAEDRYWIELVKALSNGELEGRRHVLAERYLCCHHHIILLIAKNHAVCRYGPESEKAAGSVG